MFKSYLTKVAPKETSLVHEVFPSLTLVKSWKTLQNAILPWVQQSDVPNIVGHDSDHIDCNGHPRHACKEGKPGTLANQQPMDPGAIRETYLYSSANAQKWEQKS